MYNDDPHPNEATLVETPSAEGAERLAAHMRAQQAAAAPMAATPANCRTVDQTSWPRPSTQATSESAVGKAWPWEEEHVSRLSQLAVRGLGMYSIV